MRNPSYVISSGWWCDDNTPDEVNENDRNGWVRQGDKFNRSREFHKLWYESIHRYTQPEKILIIDSNSPVLPPLNASDQRLEFLSLPVNSGHSTTCPHQFCGWTKSVFLGLQYAICTETDYFVYVEQDVLLKGEGIIEHAISRMQNPCMFGCGQGTPQVLQQSLFIIKTSEALDFLHRYASIQYPDRDVSPEQKFGLACDARLSALQPLLLLLKPKKLRKLTQRRAVFDRLPFGYGRTRPIDFSQPYFYFQHGTALEIEQYCETSGLSMTVSDIPPSPRYDP